MRESYCGKLWVESWNWLVGVALVGVASHQVFLVSLKTMDPGVADTRVAVVGTNWGFMAHSEGLMGYSPPMMGVTGEEELVGVAATDAVVGVAGSDGVSG